jgi:hypothetical protein
LAFLESVEYWEEGVETPDEVKALEDEEEIVDADNITVMRVGKTRFKGL